MNRRQRGPATGRRLVALGLGICIAGSFWRLAAGGSEPAGAGRPAVFFSAVAGAEAGPGGTFAPAGPVLPEQPAGAGEASGPRPGAGEPARNRAVADAFARAVQQISYRLERLDPARLQDDPASLQVELATPEMPFVSVVAARGPGGAGDEPATGGATGGSDGQGGGGRTARAARGGGSLPAVLLIAFGPRFPETAGHLIATWDGSGQGVRLQVIDERSPAPIPPAGGATREAGTGGEAGPVAAPGGGPSGSPAGLRFGLAAIFKAARLVPEGPGRPAEMLVVTEHYPGGGPAEQHVALLQRRGDHWQLRWASGGPGWPGAARQIILSEDLQWLDVVLAGEPGTATGVPGPGVPGEAGWATNLGLILPPRAPAGAASAAGGLPGDRGGATPGEEPAGPAAGTILMTPEGPVRPLIQQRWQRRGDGYAAVATRPLPQPLIVLQEFILRVSRGQTREAAELVRDGDPALVAEGARLLSQRPLGQGWLVEPAGGAYDRGPLVVTRSDGQRVTVSFATSGGTAGWPGGAVWIEGISAGGAR